MREPRFPPRWGAAARRPGSWPIACALLLLLPALGALADPTPPAPPPVPTTPAAPPVPTTLAPPPALPDTPEAWRAAARRDVEAAYTLFLQNHPGMRNAEDPGFQEQLRRARARGLELADRTDSAAGFAATLGAFSALLQDGHAKVVDASSAPRTVRWPGFVPAWRGERMWVFRSQLPDAPAGAEILGCDGRSVRTLVRENVFAFRGRPDEPGQWWTLARDLFQDDGNPFVVPPRRCVLRAGNRLSTLVLGWRPGDAEFTAWRAASYNGERLEPGLSTPRPGLFWFALPTFTPDAGERERYQRDFAALAARRDELLRAEAVVIDLRHNQGGSDFWPTTLARLLWGQARVDALSSPSEVWWRLSEDNLRYLKELKARLDREGPAESAAWADSVVAGMYRAQAAGQDFYIEPADADSAPGSDDPAATPALSAPVYVIVPGQCASACLDALDLFTRFANTRLVGAPSSADTVYLEIRVTATPDGLARVVIPTKLYRKRPRAAGEVYWPAIEVDALAWSTDDFRTVIEADLKAAGRAPSVSGQASSPGH